LKRRVLLYWTHITFGVLPKKVKNISHFSKMNFPRADQRVEIIDHFFDAKKMETHCLIETNTNNSTKI